MASVDFDDDPDRPAVATPPGVPRITVRPERAPVTFDDNPGQPPPSKAVETGKQQGAMSWPAWLGQGAGDFVEGAADMATFGMMPRIDAGIDVITGRQPDYSTALGARTKRLEGMRERSPYATFGGNVAGGVAGGIGAGAAKVGTNIASRLGASVPARIAGYGTEAGLIGAGQGAGHTYSGEVEDYLKAAKEGGITGAVIGGALGPLTPRSAVAAARRRSTHRPADQAAERGEARSDRR